MATVYRKTAQGSEAIAKRTFQLSPRERALLIMVDGKRSEGDLVGASGAFAPALDLIQVLLSAGLIESVSTTEQGSPPQGNTPKTRAALTNAQRLAVRQINNLLGPAGADLCIRLEDCRSVSEFRTELRRARTVLQQAVGAHAAGEFAREVESSLNN